MPLLSNLQVGKKPGNEAWIEPVVTAGNPPIISYKVHSGKGVVPAVPKQGKGGRFKCVACGTVTKSSYIREQASEYGFGHQLTAIVAESSKSRIYLAPSEEQSQIAESVAAPWRPDGLMADNPRYMSPPLYGMTAFGDLFTSRQLTTLTAFSDLAIEARAVVESDAIKAGMGNDGVALTDDGCEAKAYAEAVSTYLSFSVSKAVDRNSSLCFWEARMDRLRGTFGRQVIPMVWDFAETNPFAGAGGDLFGTTVSLCEVLDKLTCRTQGHVRQSDAAENAYISKGVVSTDPPYYDYVGYADLSDFFYAWLKRCLSDIYPELFSTLQAPKKSELVASPYRFDGDKSKAKNFFETGLFKAFDNLRSIQPLEIPLTVYYAFKQSDSTDSKGRLHGSEVASTGWETILHGLMNSGFQVTGTWPIRTEQLAGLKGKINALASSIVIVCRPLPEDSPVTTRKDLIRKLEEELPSALEKLQQGNIAPVDFAQAAIGPGMGVFSRYSKVLDASGEPMRVRDALVLINQQLYEFLNEGTEELDSETQFAIAWFKQFQYNDGKHGEADVLARAKNVTVDALVDAGIAYSKSNTVRLLERDDYDHEEWDPTTDPHLNAWEVMQRMIWGLEHEGVKRPAQILQATGGLGETARELAYRMYQLCDEKGWAKEALAYNTLVQNWPDIEIAKTDIYGAGYQPELDMGE